MKRARRVLLVAFAFSLLLHAIVALVLHPATADFQSQPEAISVVRSAWIIENSTEGNCNYNQSYGPCGVAFGNTMYVLPLSHFI